MTIFLGILILITVLIYSYRFTLTKGEKKKSTFKLIDILSCVLVALVGIGLLYLLNNIQGV